ncbi:MAG TPA: biotin--[acetyl-CoA-carboxylase] ligase, partial [Thermofilum sp.]|nr:biotin--[acetyl-CoA-carboxylase] ligase [Thermofilum sp.]
MLMYGSFLQDCFTKVNIIKYNKVTSTMDVAWKLLTEGLHKWTIIVAEEQYKGRGRHGRTWASPKGGLWMSLIVDRNVIKEVPLNMYPFIAPLAVISSIDKIYNIKTHIRWPNDIVFKGKKIGGILIETSFKGNNIEGAIIGIGINTNIT